MLGQTIGDNNRRDETIGKRIIDAKIMQSEVKVAIGAKIEKIIDETLVMTEIEVEIEIGVEKEKDVWHLVGMIEDIKAQTIIQGLGIDLLLESQ